MTARGCGPTTAGAARARLQNSASCAKLGERFDELQRQLEEADRHESQCQPEAKLSDELKDTKRRLSQVDAALQELKRVEESGETTPSRVPLTDPESRITPNKEGGFAPNYTPLVTVDAHSGLIVAADVIAMTDEDYHLLDQLEQVQEDFGLEQLPQEVLADGMMANGDNLIELESRGVTLYAPAPSLDPEKNPALRDDPTKPVAEQQWDQLPAKKGTLAKEAFVYDPARDCYFCPLSKQLTRRNTTSELTRSGRRSKRTRYRAEASTCAACPLVSRCVKAKSLKRKGREISRYDHDPHKDRLAERMATDQAQQKYARRREVAERPFAVIKQHVGAQSVLAARHRSSADRVALADGRLQPAMPDAAPTEPSRPCPLTPITYPPGPEDNPNHAPPSLPLRTKRGGGKGANPASKTRKGLNQQAVAPTAHLREPSILADHGGEFARTTKPYR